jgi:hypothetical protein
MASELAQIRSVSALVLYAAIALVVFASTAFVLLDVLLVSVSHLMGPSDGAEFVVFG